MEREFGLMSKKEFEAGEFHAFLYTSTPASPLVVMNNFTGDGEGIARGLHYIGAECSLLVVSGVDWNRDMSPWASEPVFKGEAPFSGGAEAYLTRLTDDILPEAKRMLSAEPKFTAIAGYSLAGLFALYSLCRCGEFSRAASVSGSLWFPGFKEYIMKYGFCEKPDRIYLSLGDKEAKTNNPILGRVRDNTERIAIHYRSLGVDTTFELNPGNHFKDAEARCVKAVAALIK